MTEQKVYNEEAIKDAWNKLDKVFYSMSFHVTETGKFTTAADFMPELKKKVLDLENVFKDSD